MPKVSSAASEQQVSGFGIQDGIARFSNGRFENVQHEKDGQGTTPKFCYVATVTKLDENYQPYEEDISEEKEFVISWGSKASMTLNNCPFQPGTARNASDPDPVGLGHEIGVKGNTIYVASEEEYKDEFPDRKYPPRFFQDSEFALLMKNLEKLGFSKDVNDQSYAPNYDGLVVEFQTVNKESLCKKLNVRYKPQEGKTQTAWEVTKIHTKPYESKSPEKSTGKTVSNGSANGNGDAKELFAKVIAGVAAKNAGKEFELGQKLQSAFMPVMTEMKLIMDDKKKILNLIKDQKFLEANADQFVLVDGKVSF